MSEQITVLRIKIDANGLVTGSAQAAAGLEKVSSSSKKASVDIDKISEAAKKAKNPISGMTDSLFNLRNILAGVGLRSFANELIAARQASDRINNTFKVSSANAQIAGDKMNFLRQKAQELGLDIRSTGQSFAKFDVASQGTALSAKQIRDIFVSVSEATTAMGLSSEVADGALLALQQMISKGTVQSEELRGQFGERIPGAFRLAAEAMGWTQLQLAKNLEQGKVLSGDMLPKLAAKLHEVFGPGSAEGAKLLSAEINRLKNEIFDFLVKTSKDIELPAIVRVLTNNFDELALAIKVVMGLSLLVWLHGVYLAFIAAEGAAYRAAMAMKAFWASAAGPYAVVVAAILAASEGAKIFSRHADEAMSKMQAQMAAFGEKYQSFIAIKQKLAEGGSGAGSVTDEERSSVQALVAETEAQIKANEAKRKSIELYLEESKYIYGGTAEYDAKKVELAELAQEYNLLTKNIQDYIDAEFRSHSKLGQGPKTNHSTNDYRNANGTGNRLSDAVIASNIRLQKKDDEEATAAAKKYADALEELRNKYDPLRKAQEQYAEAQTLALDAMSKGLLTAGQYSTAMAAAAAAVDEKLHPGINDLLGDMTKAEFETRNAIKTNIALANAYGYQSSSVRAAQKDAFILGKTQEFLARNTRTNSNAVRAMIPNLKALAAAEFESADAARIRGDAYNKYLEVGKAINSERARIAAINQGSKALREYNAVQEAADTIMQGRLDMTAEDLKLINDLIPKISERNKLVAESAVAANLDGMRYELDWQRKYNAALTEGSAALRQWAIDKAYADTLRAGGTTEQAAVAGNLTGQQIDADRAKARIEDAKKLGEVLLGIDGTWGKISGHAVNFGEAMKKMKGAGRDMKASFEGMASAIVAVVGIMKEAGLVAGPGGGESQFGGQMSGTYSGEGAIVGAIVGAVIGSLYGATEAGAAAGGAIGEVLGSMINKGADEGLIILEQKSAEYGSRFGATLTGFNNKVGRTAMRAGQEITDMLNDITTSLGGSITGITSDFKMKIREDEVIIFVNGLRRVFKEMADAVSYAVTQLLRTAEYTNLDPMFEAALRDNNSDNLEGLKSDLEAISSIISFGFTDSQNNIRAFEGELDRLADVLMRSVTNVEQVQRGFSNLANEEIHRWQNERNRITGDKQSNSEKLALLKADGEMWNAEKALRIAELKSKLEFLKTELEMANAEHLIGARNVDSEFGILNARANLNQNSIDMQKAFLGTEVELVSTAAQLLGAQITATMNLIGALMNMPDIDIGNLHLPNIGGSGSGSGTIDTGPSEAEQNLIDFNEFLRTKGLDALSDYQRGMAEMNREYDDMLATLRASSASAAEMAEGERALAALRIAEAARLREEIADSLGSPMEGVRDRIANLGQRVADWFASGQEIVNQYLNGEIGSDQLQEALDRANELWAEFGDSLRSELMNMALYFTDAMGDTEESARIRAELAQLEWTFKKMEFRMMLEAIRQVPGALSDTDYQRWLDFINSLPDQAPTPPDQQQNNFNEFIRTESLKSLSDYQRAMEELNRTFDEQLEALRASSASTDEIAAGESALAELRREGVARLREEIIDSFGTPMEAVRDKIAQMQQKLHDFYLSNVELRRQFDANEISADEFAAAMARSSEIMGEFGESLRSELMNMALYFTDAMGDTKESARIRAELAQLEWTFKKMEFRMMLEAIRQVPGALSDTDYQRWLDFINGLPDQAPEPPDQQQNNFNEFIRTESLKSLSNYQRAMEELNRTFDEQLEALRASSASTDEIAAGESALAELRREGVARLREEIIDSFGTPMEAVRDKIAQMQQKLHDFYLSNVELRRQFDAGEISADEFAAAMARSSGIMGEFGEMMRSELMNLALYFTDAMGDTKESARIRAELAQLEWTFKKMEFRMMLEAIRQVPGALSDTDYQRWLDFIDSLPDQAPTPPQQQNNNNNGGIDDARARILNMLTEALNRLRSALEDYKAFQQELLIGPLSGATQQQQAAAAQTEYERLLALAQAGNLDAIEALPAAARQYLELAGQFLDPSSAGYQSILNLVQSQMAGVQGMIESVLNSVPDQMSGVEDRLDTIAEILAVIAGGIPLPVGGGSNPHAGLVYYGPDWGWHPMGWSPGGNTPGGNLGPDAASRAAIRFSANGDSSRNVIAASFSGNGVVKVEDEETRRAVSRLESKLDRIESAQVNDTSKAERYRRRLGQRAGKNVGLFYADEVAG